MNAVDRDLERRLRAGPPGTDGVAVEAATAAALQQAAVDDLVDVAYVTADSPIGPLLLAATPAGLVRIGFHGEGETPVLDQLAARLSPRVVELPSRLDGVRRQLDEYFEGRRHDFDVPIDWSLSSGFRRRTLQALFEQVHFGEITTYAELAARAGNPRASRAVGSAMATNPVPVVVPCHRVLRTGGGLGGYGGGLDVKRRLLALEGVTFFVD